MEVWRPDTTIWGLLWLRNISKYCVFRSLQLSFENFPDQKFHPAVAMGRVNKFFRFSMHLAALSCEFCFLIPNSETKANRFLPWQCWDYLSYCISLKNATRLYYPNQVRTKGCIWKSAPPLLFHLFSSLFILSTTYFAKIVLLGCYTS